MLLTPSSKVRICQSTRYYATIQEKMAEDWGEMRKKIDEEIIKMEVENDEQPYEGSNTTIGVENAKIKFVIDILLVTLFTKLTTKLRNDLKSTAGDLEESKSPLSTENIEDLARDASLLRYLKKIEKKVCMADSKAICAWQGQSTNPMMMQALT